MNHLIVMLFPSLIGYKFLMHINREEKFNLENKIVYYLILVLLSNTIGLIISKVFFGFSSNLDSSLENYPLFTFKYIIISIIINILLSFVISFFRKNVSFSIEIKDEDNEKE